MKGRRQPADHGAGPIDEDQPAATPSGHQGGRAFMSVLDQGISTVTNAGLVVAVASQESAANFGEFTLAYAVVAFVLGMQRAGVADPFLVKASETGIVDPGEESRFVRNLVGSSVSGSVTMAAAGLLVGGTLGEYLFWLGVLSWAVLVQDGLRYYAFAQAHPGLAVLMDGVWLVAFGVAALAVPDLGGLDAVRIWGLAAVPSMLVGLLALGLPSLRTVRRTAPPGGWIRLSFGLEFIAVTLGGLALLGSLRVLLGPEAAAAVAAILAVFRPIRSGAVGLRLYYLPRLRSRMGGDGYRSELIWWVVVMVGMWCAWLVLCLLAQDVLSVLLGDTWEFARQVLAAAAIFELVANLTQLWADHLKVTDRSRSLVMGRVIFVVLYLSGSVLGAFAGDLSGAVAGLAIGATLGLTIWIVALDHGLSLRQARPVPPGHEDPP